MSFSEQTKVLATTVAAAAALAVLVTHLQGPAKEVVKRGLVDKLETVGRPTTSAKATDISSDDDTYDFIIIGGGKVFGRILCDALQLCIPLKRYRWISSCIASFGTPRFQGAVTRSWGQVRNLSYQKEIGL